MTAAVRTIARQHASAGMQTTTPIAKSHTLSLTNPRHLLLLPQSSSTTQYLAVQKRVHEGVTRLRQVPAAPEERLLLEQLLGVGGARRRHHHVREVAPEDGHEEPQERRPDLRRAEAVGGVGVVRRVEHRRRLLPGRIEWIV